LSLVVGELLHFARSWEEAVSNSINKRMEKIIEFSTLGTDSKNFEISLNKLREEGIGKVRWIISKFISSKLDKDFDNREIVKIENISVGEYSDLLEDLIGECENSIYMTCPWSPKSWFDELNIEKVNTKNIKLEHFPKHFRSFLNSTVDKKRVVNLSNEQWDELIKKENKIYFNNFIKKANKYKLKFAKMGEIKNTHPETKEGDYNVLDDKVVIKWQKYKQSLETCSNARCIIYPRCDKSKCIVGVCTLILTELKVYKSIFENMDDKAIFKDAKEIKQILNS
jgi:hypothetical protein